MLSFLWFCVKYVLIIQTPMRSTRFGSAFVLSLAISLLLSSSLGSCSSLVFSVCWVLNISAHENRPDINVWLDNTELTAIGSQGKFVSLSVTPLDVHELRTEYEGIAQVWNFSIVSDSINVSGTQRTAHLPSSATAEALKTFRTQEVFPCENGTEYLHQKESFIIALGYSRRFPLRQESGAASTLLVAWSGRSLAAHDPPHRVTLYQLEPSGLVPLCNDTTHAPRYRFTGLQGCGSYVACVERARGPSLLCLATLTDPDVPANFRVTAWDSSSLTVGWDYPPSDRLASFLVTVFHTNGSGHVLEERRYRQEPDRRGFTAGPLSPCSRVRLGLQAECRGPGPARPSAMALSDGNSANSEIINLRQSTSGPHSYTVRWSVRNFSSVSSFRVYHQGRSGAPPSSAGTR
ncbi:hypothetical protein COCON_G00232110 [Conger conger]|uniref:Fibronectin type-III domain-containing protein n=1 Tax=Conger conger TaxID=82655 RepID=A0A9Q1CUX0_CONCO|nr:hypothetical protein COCON_G00232110 [Conger conger]